MSEDLWIVPRNWERFQHRDAARSQVLPWIKNWVELDDDEAFLDLPVATRALIQAIWRGYAKTRRRLPANTASLSRRFSQRVTKQQLEALNHAGFIDIVAGIPAATAAGTPAGTEKKRKEKEAPYPTRVGNRNNNTNPRATGTNPRALTQNDKEQRHAELLEQATTFATTWNGANSDAFADHLDHLERELHTRLTHTEREQLWDQALTQT